MRIKRQYFPFVILLILLICNVTFINAQTPDAHYDFDNCTLSDKTSEYADAIPGIGGAPNCICGVLDDALEFDGNESLVFPDLDLGLKNDFALSFYFWPESDVSATEILSISSDSCRFDSVLTIKYLPFNRSIKVDIIETGSRRVVLEGQINENLCWHHLTINNNGKQYELYIDDVRVDSKEAIKKLSFQPKARLKLSGGPCIGTGTTTYKGYIDELRIWERSLEVSEINSINQRPDKIISPDQTIFLGDELQIVTGGSCSNNFNWSPTTDMKDPSEINPFVSPTETRTYVLENSYRGCTINDTINIYVLDIDNLDCNNLLLPDAFTPNNDGINETYGISNPFIIEKMKGFDIYDRWGNIVFHTNTVSDKWDGSFSGTDLNPGLYVYKISYTCKQKDYNKTGSFTIIR